MKYRPDPIDTSKLRLTDDVAELVELLAQNNHDVWARQRMAEGWRYGPRRNDSKKEHPGLVPYKELSESEKDYDRNTVAETLKTVIALGYRIKRG